MDTSIRAAERPPVSTDVDGSEPPFFPAARACPFDPSPVYTSARESNSLQRVTIWNGARPWLISRHDHIRQVLGDPRFSADVTNPAFPNTTPSQPETEGGLFFRQDDPWHKHVRRILNPDFTAKRVEAWREPVRVIVEERIDAMLDLPRPLDLITQFALPIPATVICEVLGIDASQPRMLQEAIELITNLETTHEEKVSAFEQVGEMVRHTAERKAREPDGLLLARLFNEHVANGDLSADEAVRTTVTLIGAGLETTTNMIGLGVLMLIRDPGQRATLMANPDQLAGKCAEEMLRFWSNVQTEPRRVAREDVEIGGQLIRAGEGVVCSLAAGNRDPSVFRDPESVDITRGDRRHVAFGYGVHQCIGQNLARVEMQVAWPSLFERLPNLALAVPEDELRYYDMNLTYGLRELPVTW